jgi:hypothetical protein
MESHLGAPAYTGFAGQVNTALLLYYVQVGTKAVVGDFVWLIKAIVHDTVEIVSIGQTTLDYKVLYYIEFRTLEGVENFKFKTNHSVLTLDAGTLFLPVNPELGFTIVTLSGVYAMIGTEVIEQSMEKYGSARLICKGHHWTGDTNIDNGKRYIIFNGKLTEHIPTRLFIGQCVARVRYVGQPDPSPIYSKGRNLQNRPHIATLGPVTIEAMDDMPTRTEWSTNITLSDLETSTAIQTEPMEPIVIEVPIPVVKVQSATADIGINTLPEVPCPVVKVQSTTAEVGINTLPSVQTKPNQKEKGINTVRIKQVDGRTMTKQMHYTTSETNTDVVQCRGKRVQTEVTKTESKQSQCQPNMVAKETQTMTIEDEVKQYRKCQKRTKIIPRKRKRTQSGQIINLESTFKSRKLSSTGIRAYFKSQNPRHNVSSAPLPPEQCIAPSDSKFKYVAHNISRSVLLDSCLFILGSSENMIKTGQG